jgi:N6-L-threonylcarbamoyladenine synthase
MCNCLFREKRRKMIILGIETSCDETSISVLKDGKEMLSNHISSQIEIHKEYGGVVPEIASRHHIKNIAAILEESLSEAKITLGDVDYIAVTYAPGLIGALLVGISFAKGLSYGRDIPIIPVHHIKGHIYANFLEHKVELPAIALVVSGGHTNIIHIDENHKFTNLGGTLDDAVGESYDKVSRVMGLGYPGGPIIDRLAYEGNPDNIPMPEPKVGGYEFSFSGVKTSVINYVNKMNMKKEEYNPADIAASFQARVVDILCKKTIKAAKEKGVKNILIAGGVAANSLLRKELLERSKVEGIDVFYPSMKLCTDNAGMIAVAGYFKLKYGEKDRVFADLKLNGVANMEIEED